MTAKQAASSAGIQAASKWVAPVFGAAAVPAGVRTSLYGYGLAGAAGDVRSDIRKTKNIAKKFSKEFGEEAVRDYDKFDPQGDTYKQWRRLRKLKFLEPYIRSGHEGLTSAVTPATEGVDIVRTLRRLTGGWKDYAIRHYDAFSQSPRAALKVLATEGVEETKDRGLKRALGDLLNDYDVLAKKHGPYHGLRRLYNEPWAKVSLSNPRSIKVFVDRYGNDALDEARKKQALLFYASKSKLYAPAWYGALTSGSSALGHGLGLGGAAVAGYGGYKGVSALARMLAKRGQAEQPVEAPEPNEGLGPVSAVLAGANPFSSKVDVMGVPFKPETRKEELKQVLPAILGKGLVGAVVVPSMVRSGVEAVRGLAKQGPYAKVPGRLRAGAAGALFGSVIPLATLTRAFRTGRVLKSMERGAQLPTVKLKTLAKQLGEAPLRSSVATQQVIKNISKGLPIPPEMARKARREMFEPNTTVILNALLGGGITGYAGYASYARGKRLREAFEQVYGKELPPELAAVIMNPEKLRRLSKMRHETIRSERRMKSRQRRKDKQERKRG